MKYRKRPVVIEAVQWKKNMQVYEVIQLLKGGYRKITRNPDGTLFIETLEGTMKANIDDYIIKGVNGEFYPVKPDIFKQTYEKVSE